MSDSIQNKRPVSHRKPLFELKDIQAQLEPQQLKELEHILYFAKETRAAQFCEFTLTVGMDEYGSPREIALGRPIVVWPSGKMMFWKGKKPVEVNGEWDFLEYEA